MRPKSLNLTKPIIKLIVRNSEIISSNLSKFRSESIDPRFGLVTKKGFPNLTLSSLQKIALYHHRIELPPITPQFSFFISFTHKPPKTGVAVGKMIYTPVTEHDDAISYMSSIEYVLPVEGLESKVFSSLSLSGHNLLHDPVGTN